MLCLSCPLINLNTHIMLLLIKYTFFSKILAFFFYINVKIHILTKTKFSLFPTPLVNKKSYSALFSLKYAKDAMISCALS